MKRKSGLICSTAHCQAEVRECYVPGHTKCLTYTISSTIDNPPQNGEFQVRPPLDTTRYISRRAGLSA